MDRQLFLHHYLPALLFKIALVPVVGEHLVTVWGRAPHVTAALFVALFAAVAAAFLYYAPFRYAHGSRVEGNWPWHSP